MKAREKGEQRTRRRCETPTDGSAGTLNSHVLAGFQNEWNLSPLSIRWGVKKV